jgi:polyhydroxyalkanoate synthase
VAAPTTRSCRGAATARAHSAARGALDVLLTDAAVGGRSRFLPAGAAVRTVAGLARRPRRPAGRAGALGAELARVAAGRSELRPAKGDRRFADHAWDTNPLLRRLLQAYLAAADGVDGLISDAELDWRDERQARFAAGNVLDALAPTNFPWSNPAVLREIVDHGGTNLARGARQFVRDVSRSPRLPASVDTTGFAVGENLGTSAGSVVLRTDVFELIQYKPQAEQVYDVPLLVVPPTINKFYAIDLAPERSLVEFSVRQGRQMFVISWRNPDARHASWDFDTYVCSILDALETVEQITGSDRTVLGGICSGGILATITAAYLAGIGRQDRLAALVLAVTVIDNANAGTVSSMVDARAAAAAKQLSKRKGYLDGKALAEVFAWLRPGDLIWNYWVNNYLLGKRPPAFDILFWNADTTRMAAGLHADFVDLAVENKLVRPKALTVLGVPIDLAAVTVDAYVAAGIADHITPWENCYRTTQLLGGKTRFVLSTSGHIAALVNPPGNPKATYHTNDENPADAKAWLAQAETHQGTWWTDVADWLNARCGDKRPAPAELGSTAFPPVADAPGTYVFDK